MPSYSTAYPAVWILFYLFYWTINLTIDILLFLSVHEWLRNIDHPHYNLTLNQTDATLKPTCVDYA